jgi:hypothetical protein
MSRPILRIDEGLMRKRTVITTERREVWIIRQPSGDTEEVETAGHKRKSPDSLATVSDQYSEIGIFPDEHEYRSEKGEKK